MSGALHPDVQSLQRFSTVLFKHADQRGFVSLRAFPHRANTPSIFIEPITLGDAQFLDVVCERARQAATWREPAVFCPPVATFKSGKSAAEDNIHEGVTLAAELDETPNAAHARLEGWLGEPTLAMRSGGEWTNPETGEVEPKLHLHWRLKAPARTSEGLGKLKEARRLIVLLVGGDPTAAPICHPLRWAGSWHTKGEPRLATIVSESESEIDLTEALDALREEAGAAGIGGSGRSGDFRRAAQGPAKLLARDPKDVARALAVIPNDGSTHWDAWSNDIGIAIFGASGGEDWGLREFDTWSAKSPKYDAENTAKRWAGFHRSPPNRAGMGKLWYLAEQASPGWMKGGMPPEHEAALDDMNAQYFVAKEGGKTWVISFERERTRLIPSYMKFGDFSNLYMNRSVKVEAGNKVQYVPLGKWWLQHPERQQYEGLVFAPGNPATVIDGRFNLWRGWGVEPRRGNWKLMRKHIWMVLAARDKERFKYTMRWLAWMIQHPDQRAEVALVFKGNKGTGKGTLGNCLMKLFGQHSLQVSNAKHLVGNFNAHMRDTCFLFGDECYWPGDKQAEGTLKRLITEPTLFIEAKGRDAITVPNYLHVMLASNEQWIVPAGENERPA